MRLHDETRGLLLVAHASLWFALMSMLIKSLGGALPASQVSFFRCALSVPAVLALMSRQGLPARSRNWRLLVARGVWGVSSMLCYFWALGHVPLGLAVLLNYTSPLFAALFAAAFLDERLTPRAWGLLAAALAGLALVVRPAPGGDWHAAAVALLAGALGGAAFATTKALTREESPWRIIFYFNATGAAATLPLAVLQWRWPQARAWAALAGAAACATVAQGLMTRGFEKAPVSKGSAATMLSVIVTALAGWAFWGERLDPITWLGMAVVIASVAALAFAAPLPAVAAAPEID